MLNSIRQEAEDTEVLSFRKGTLTGPSFIRTEENKEVSPNIAIFSICSFFIGGLFASALAEVFPSKPQIKVDVEIKRTANFLKILIFCKNEGKKREKIKLKMLIYKRGADRNVSQISQVKDLSLEPEELALPFLTELNVKPEDAFEIILQVFDEAGNLLDERTFRSESL